MTDQEATYRMLLIDGSLHNFNIYRLESFPPHVKLHLSSVEQLQHSMSNCVACNVNFPVTLTSELVWDIVSKVTSLQKLAGCVFWSPWIDQAYC